MLREILSHSEYRACRVQGRFQGRFMVQSGGGPGGCSFPLPGDFQIQPHTEFSQQLKSGSWAPGP